MTNVNGYNDKASLLKASDDDDECKLSVSVTEQQNRPGCFIATKPKITHLQPGELQRRYEKMTAIQFVIKQFE